VLSEFALFSLSTKTPYASSKHAARVFTESLAAELHGSGATVTAVYPGATATNLVRKGHAVDPARRDLEAGFLARGLAPEVVARRILRGVDAGWSRVLIGRDTRAIDLAVRLALGLVQAGVRRFWWRVPFL
jgi:short-subunit dehydrogenase